jgi:UTP--glucose-1-phosphate uridylyltransferase
MQKADHLPEFVTKMRREGLQPLVIDTFTHFYRQLLSGESGYIRDGDIRPVDSQEIVESATLDGCTGNGRQAMGQTARIVLNGGLGTTMGLTGAKSLISVKDGKSFLEIIVEQCESSGVRLALMNSFRTDKDTCTRLAQIKPLRTPITFIQNKFPKICQDTFAPASWPQNPELEWNPPGHGDVYTALNTSGMLQALLKDGIRYAFICNCDNLGARLDPSLLGYFRSQEFPFIMEVAEKTPTDIKGGHLARHRNGRLILREAAQCPEDEQDAFQDIRRYRYFNTNNIWINLQALQNLFEEQGTIRLPMIVNPKSVNPRDESSPTVVQIETAMGAAISLFERATAVIVPRSRFLPVKTCSDLLAMRSDCFVYTEDHDVVVNPGRNTARLGETVQVSLDPKVFKNIDMLDARFPEGAPSLVNCEFLSIEGDVRFEKDVTIRGRVRIKNSRPTQAVVKKGKVIEADLLF